MKGNKEELRKKREYFQPIRRKDLLEHEKIYEQRLHMKLAEKREKREKWYKDIGYGDYDPSIYHSKYLSSAEQEEKEKIYTPDPMIGIIEQLDKQKNYAKFVKEMHRPKISVSKQEQMKKIIHDIEGSGQSRKLGLNKYNSEKEINKTRTKSIESAMHDKRSDDLTGIKSRDYGGSQSVIRKRIKWSNPMIPKPKLKRKGIVVDYLLKKRVIRQEKEMLDPDYRYKNETDWDALAMSKSQRAHAKSFSIDYSDSSILPQSRFDKEMKKPADLVLQHKLEIIRTQAKN